MIRVSSISQTNTRNYHLPIPYLQPLQIRAAMMNFWNGYVKKRSEPEYGINPLEYLGYMLSEVMLYGWTFENLQEEYPEERDIIGICDMRENMILLDNKLKNGHELWRKCSFTVVHEIAHWVIHKPIYDSLNELDSAPSQNIIMCRNNDIGLHLYNNAQSRLDGIMRMEWQTNIGGSVLLFPAHKIKKFARENAFQQHGFFSTY